MAQKKDINNQVKNLIISNKYFVSLKVNKTKKYWQSRKDPDGNHRDKIKNFFKERKIFLNNNKSLLQIIKSLNPKSICDVGCGPGFLLSSLKVKNKVGIEIDDLAANKASNFCRIYKMDLNKKIEINKKFDLVICYHVIEHIEKPLQLIKNLKKIIKKDGYLVIGTPDFDSAMARYYKNKYRMLHDQTHISLFSLDSLCRMIRDFNFKIKKIDFPYFETNYFSKKNLLQIFNKKKISPPFYGSFMTIVAQNK